MLGFRCIPRCSWLVIQRQGIWECLLSLIPEDLLSKRNNAKRPYDDKVCNTKDVLMTMDTLDLELLGIGTYGLEGCDMCMMI